MAKHLCVIPGDGVGIEVVPAAVAVLKAVLPDLTISQAEAGWAVFERTGTALPQATLHAAQHADAILFGAVSSPSHPVEGYKSPIVALRKHLDTFANLRPAKGWLTPNDLDLLVVRENTEGLYVGQERHQTGANGSQQVITERLITQAGTARVARLAFAIAATEGRKLTVVHKANVIRQGDGLWRSTCLALQADFPDITVDEGLVDSVAYHMVRHPEKYQLLLCPNLYGDILSDLASGLADGLGMAPSLSIGNRAAIAEPVHGSAPDIAGQGIANPIAAILSAALLCRYRWQRLDLATIIEQAVAQVLQQGLRTPDLVIEPEQPTVDTVTITEAILQALTGFSL